ncbi:MAG: hypothetical protein ACKV22_22065 [Bryobacteraceae bacterium]
MLRAALVTPDPDLRKELEQCLTRCGRLVLVRKFDRYPRAEEVSNFMRAHAPQVVFLDVSAMETALDVAAALARANDSAFTVAVHRGSSEGLLLRLMRGGMRELLVLPVDDRTLEEILDRAEEAARAAGPTPEQVDLVYSFLPAKAGDGATFTAVNTAFALARLPETRPLLMDFDLNMGFTRFLLKLSNPYCARHALEKATEMDESIWAELVSPAGDLDILASGPTPRTRLEAFDVAALLAFLRKRYRIISIDHSGALEGFSADALRESQRILLVATPELPSIYLAREKLHQLKEWDLDDRVELLLNRWHKSAPLSMVDIEETLGVPISRMIPNDETQVRKALVEGRDVDPFSHLGQHYAQLAESLSSASGGPKPKKWESRVEHFALVPARYGLLPGRR